MLLQLPKIDRKTVLRLLKHPDCQFSSKNDLVKFILANRTHYQLPEINTSTFNAIFNKTDRILEESNRLDIQLVSIFDDCYPYLLRGHPDCPVIINIKGNIDVLTSNPTVAIIGTREPSILGRQSSEYLGEYFADKKFNIVSGLAKGCDAAAHKGALNVNGITTAVLAHGLDTIHPKQNISLAERITDKGALISEYFVGEQPTPRNFIQRDRIQAGLSLGTLVVETLLSGGTMHTVNYCLQYRRPLACLNPPKEYFEIFKFQGNQILINQKKASPVYKDSEFDEFITKLALV